ncbi:unnamed protein product [Linum tenue]|uniref:Uncharacterized protein n=1 Tax=Linum tenue TaxID=586396 RepID=A0AAV0R7A2_9ROSI|nr:unnamed protein product [Linum tenue]
MADILPILVATWPIKLPEREFGTGGWGSIFYHWINGEVSPCFASFAGDSLDDSFYRKEDSHYKEKCKRQTSPPPSSGAANEGTETLKN